MDLLYGILLFIGILASFLLGFFLSKFKHSINKVSLADHNELLKKSTVQETLNNELSSQMGGLKGELTDLRKTNIELESELSAKNERIRNIEEKLETQKEEIHKLNESFKREFENLANKILKENSADFNKLSGEKLENILAPLKENISRFENKIDANRKDNIKETVSLKAQIEQLTALNQMMTEEAKNLTTALKGQSKTRGDWGEMILETILEKSGLKKDEHYTLQKGHRNSQGELLKPDAIVRLPEDKHLIIDSKLSLVYYEKFCNAQADDEKNANLKLHLDAMKKHVKELSQKNYQDIYSLNTPDFIMMFVPIEPAFSVVMEHNIDFYQESYLKGIIIVTPSTLIATLKLIYSIWRQESQNRNALEIADAGGRLYDKLAGFITDMEGIGTSINKSRDTYDKAMKKLSTGRGNVLRIAEKMKDMGAKAAKKLPVPE